MLTLCHNYFGVTPSNKDGLQHVSKRKYIFGIFLLLLVVILWVVSSELTKYIYEEKKFEKPFLITYIRSSLLFIYLVVLCFTPPTRDPCRPADYSQLLEPTAETDDENYFSESSNTLGDSTFVPVRAGETTDSDDAAPRAVRFNKVAEVRVMSAAQAGEALLARLSWAASVRASEHAQRRAAAAATRRHLRLAVQFCAPWFAANYLYRVSLQHWSSGAAATYASAAGALAVAAAATTRAPGDRLTASKGVAVLLTVAAMAVAWACEVGGGGGWRGPTAALGAAAAYAAHLLMLRRELRRPDGVNSPLLVGVVGCVCGLAGWAVGGALSLAGGERAALPAARLWPWLLLDAALGPLLAETLWLWGASLTSPRAATAMLSLALPLSACASWWRGGAGGAGGAAAGALAAAGWLAALFELPHPPKRWRLHLRTAEGFATIRSIPELDEQSEALMSADEPT